VRITAVCRHWRTTIIDHSCFWRFVVVFRRPGWLQLTLQRSRDTSIRIVVRDALTFTAFLQGVLPHRNRIEFLELRIDHRDRFAAAARITPLLDAHLLSLKGLVIKICGGAFEPILPQDYKTCLLHPAQYPCLFQLDLLAVTVPWTPLLLSQLTTLSLFDCRISQAQMPAHEVFDVLRHGRRLKSIRLWNFLSGACSDYPSGSSTAIVLPDLQSLTVQDTALWIGHFVARVQLPSTGQIHLDGRAAMDGNWHNPSTYQALLSSQLTDLPALSSVTTVSLYINRSSSFQNLQCTGPQVTICSSMSTQNPFLALSPSQLLQASLEHTQERLRPATVTHLSLKMLTHLVSSTVFEKFFDALPHLRSLSVASLNRLGEHYPPPLSLLQSLATPSGSAAALPTSEGEANLDLAGEDSHTGGPVRCPELKDVSFHGMSWSHGHFLDALVGCLRKRTHGAARKMRLVSVSIIIDSLPEGEWDAKKSYFAEQMSAFASGSRFSTYTPEWMDSVL
ncbi:hypothetical protein BV20DRAFT_1071730, partial [Pilatotrama ljubarskyi]